MERPVLASLSCLPCLAFPVLPSLFPASSIAVPIHNVTPGVNRWSPFCASVIIVDKPLSVTRVPRSTNWQQLSHESNPSAGAYRASGTGGFAQRPAKLRPVFVLGP